MDWSTLKPGDPVDDASARGLSMGIKDPEKAPLGTIICFDGKRYWYDPHMEKQGDHMARAKDTQGVYWAEVKRDQDLENNKRDEDMAPEHPGGE